MPYLGLLLLAMLLPSCEINLNRPSATDGGMCADRGSCNACPDGGAKCKDAAPCAKCDSGKSCVDAAPCAKYDGGKQCPDKGACPKCPDASLADMVAKADAPTPPPFPVQIGGPLEDTGNHVKLDSQGNVYVAGHFRATATLGSINLKATGAQDIYIAKVSPQGKVLWATGMGGVNNDSVADMATDAQGNSYLVGNFKTAFNYVDKAGKPQILKTTSGMNVLVVKVLATGKIDWAEQAGQTVKTDYASEVELSPSGGCIVMGRFSTPITLGGTTLTSTKGADHFITRITSGGTWTTPTVNLNLTDVSPSSMGVDSKGNIYLSGSFNKTTSKVSSLALTLAPNSYLLNSKYKVYAPDIFWAKLDATGKVQKVANGGGKDYDHCFDMSVDFTTGDAYLAGSHRGESTFGTYKPKAVGDYDALVVKVSNAGQFIWAVDGGGSYYDSAYGVAVGPKGHLALSGKFKHEGTFGTQKINAARDPAVTKGSVDAFVAELDATKGTFRCAAAAGGYSLDYGAGVVVDGSGHKYATGMFTGQKVAFGAATLNSHGDYDGYLWKLNVCP